ncbi:MAG: hypothetical protein H0V44_11035 [Planctomycetes bacterium]|nr:hypothetical protein [Planctomycetota bacterium]
MRPSFRGLLRSPAIATRLAAAWLVLAAGAWAVDPVLPQTFLDTTYVPPTGATIAVASGGNLQAAINSALPGDVITLQAGATFTGNFTLPAKSGSSWITIRTSAPDGTLPSPGTRVGPGNASAMAKVVTNADLPVFLTSGAAHHYRLIGLEMTMTFPSSYGLVVLGNGETTAAALPYDLIIDRCWIHGSATGDVQNGVRLNSARTAIIDSRIDQCQSTTVESHCISGVNGTGPFKIVNNFLGGSTIQVLFGGAPSQIPNNVPSDIEFRLNLSQKPLSWRPGDPTYAGTQWYVKNLFELKNARRVLIDGNVFEQNWPFNGAGPDGSAQAGYAILFTVRSEGGAMPQATVRDITVRNNIIRRSNAGIAFYGVEGAGATTIKVENNLFDDIGLNWGNNSRSGQIAQFDRVPNVTFNHNTMIHDGDISFATTGSSAVPVSGFVFTNNIAHHGCVRTTNTNWGINGVGTNPGDPTLSAFFPGAACTKNVFAVQPGFAVAYPAGNTFLAAWSNVGFTDFAGRNYRLLASSAYRNAGTDGKDIGCDFDALAVAMNVPSTSSGTGTGSGSGSGSGTGSGTATAATAGGGSSQCGMGGLGGGLAALALMAMGARRRHLVR